MASSLDILAILSDKDNYDRFSPFIKEHLVGVEAYTIIKDMGDFLKKHDEMTWKTFAPYFFMVKHPMFKPDKVEIYKEIFDSLETHTPNEDLVEELTEHFISKDYATKIGEAALSIVEGKGGYDMDSVHHLVDEYEVELDKAGDIDSFLVTDDAAEILKATSSSNGLSFRLPELQETIGRIRKGHFIVISAYVGAGKTTLLASEAVELASQMEEGKHLLWFNNEEDGNAVRKRIQQSATGFTSKDMEDNPTGFISAWNAHPAKGRILVYDRGEMYTRDMERVIKRYPPGLIIIDQLWKCHRAGNATENEVTKLSMVFNWGREMAKRHCPVITVHQADSSAHGQLWIEANQMYMSKVGLQGEMDAIITLGRSLDPGFENIRGLYTPKNKLTGKETFKAHVELDAERAVYNSLGTSGRIM